MCLRQLSWVGEVFNNLYDKEITEAQASRCGSLSAEDFTTSMMSFGFDRMTRSMKVEPAEIACLKIITGMLEM